MQKWHKLKNPAAFAAVRSERMRFWHQWGQARAWFAQRGLALEVTLAYGALVAVFLTALAQFYIPGKGFTYLIAFGAKQEDTRLSKLRKLEFHVERNSDGYDAQYYAQIAMDPSLQNTQLRHAVDSLPYRARRILFPAVAYAFGFGEPSAILQAYALLSAVSWLLLAAVLLHWFPPRSWNNFIRWTGLLFSFGVCVSVRNALVDGPSLLLIAFGILLLEKGRPWWAAAVLAVSGLGKETNLLAAAALLPATRGPARNWLIAALRGVLVVTPLALWIVYITLTVGPAGDPGARNFDLPFAAYLRKWTEIANAWSDLSVANPWPLWGLFMLVALTAQSLYLVLRPQWNQAWWRIGISYAVLMIFLGDAVWEGYPGAASRVLLPMQLAFNILVPSAGRGWLTVLLLGNLTLWAAPTTLRAPAGEGYVLRAGSELYTNAKGDRFRVTYLSGWYGPEEGSSSYWNWAAGDAALSIHNPHAKPMVTRFRFGLTAEGSRQVIVRLNGVELWQIPIPVGAKISLNLPNLMLPPGQNRIDFVTDKPPGRRLPDLRFFTFCIHDLRIDALRFEEPPGAEAGSRGE